MHGGGFVSGSGQGNDLARFGDVADVVLVAVNYRLGPIGFTCLDTDEAAGNMGMLDVVMALEWVQENIEKFGGDPTKVNNPTNSPFEISFNFFSPLSFIGDHIW